MAGGAVRCRDGDGYRAVVVDDSHADRKRSFGNLVPLRDLAEQLADDRVIEQFGGNLLVFAALGFLLPVRRPWFARSSRILLAGAAASIAVETAQFALAIGRHSSVDDVLINAAGACLAGQLSRHLWASRAVTDRSESALSRTSDETSTPDADSAMARSATSVRSVTLTRLEEPESSVSVPRYCCQARSSVASSPLRMGPP
ncbi:VanZ family protein [Nocardia asiatica]|uniref:VanZ family protein n=1 Tax=Nocardia asiatica TaxID=209252 RepID=UPI001C3F3B96|nr:VanZ family protein [Nocardia asiatica]